MNKLIVVVFDTDTAAFEGMAAARTLHTAGDISLYGAVVLAKDAEGNVELKSAEDRAGGSGWLMGFFGGSLVGMLAGPAGLLAGASVGGLTGMMFDMNRAGVDAGFLDEVSVAMSPGKHALVMEVDEVWTTPLDTRMAEQGGMVFRRLRAEVAEDQLVRESEAVAAEMDAIAKEFDDAEAEARESMKAQMDAAKQKMQVLKDNVDKQLTDAKADADAKLDTLQAQLSESSENKKAKIEKRMGEVRESFDKRKAKLEAAAAKLA